MSRWRRRRAARGWTTAARLRRLVFLCWAMLVIVSFTAVGSFSLQSENIRLLTLAKIPAVDANIQVLHDMTDAQTGLNAYELSGDRALLQPYFGAYDRTMASLATLQDKLVLGTDDDADLARHKGFGDRQRLAAEQWWANALYVEQTLSRGGRADAFEGRVLFDRFVKAHVALDRYLTTERDEYRLAALQMVWRGEAVTIAAALVALAMMLVLGRRVAFTISRPLTELRDAVVSERGAELGACGSEDEGSTEIRSLAISFNELSERHRALQQTQARALGAHRVTSEIGRAIRAASDTQQALDVMCAALGEGLVVDRVIGNTIGADRAVLLGAQWHRPDLPPVGDLTELPELGELAEELWLSGECLARDDLLVADLQSLERVRVFCRVAGARASVMVPIGFGDRVIGMIYVLMVGGPRTWATSETNVVQAVAGFVARAIVEAESQAHQREFVEQVQRLDKQKSDFLAMVGHELRTPLTSINGYLELLQGGDAGELTVQQHRMLEVVGRSTDRLRSLIEDVLTISRIEDGVSKDNYVEVSISALITRIGEELWLLAQSSAIELEIDAGPQEAIVLGDKTSLDRAVVNVLSNAIKFSRPGGVVTIGSVLDQEARRVVITCQDRGVGIPAHDQGDLFTRFFRASNARDQEIPGTGLGLSIVKQIVEDYHGGQLRLISVEDEGTTVIMDLPLYEPLEAQQPQGTVGNDSQSGDVSANVPDLAH
ncbi:MAG: GAF domain-containing protein [Actinobacteria bacterium]|nr:GAF domain-containing protein [Actinomycetota bacterium]